jgi:predicted regulator of Ras-like GTPase activity (Roadblock/LC7/MglB family)
MTKGDTMSASERFANRISQIKGVKYFVLARRDGQIVTHNLSDPDDLAAMTTLCGLQTEEIRTTFGFSGFRLLTMTRTNQENLLLFKIDKYFLSVIHTADADPESLTGELNTFLKNLTRQSKTG